MHASKLSKAFDRVDGIMTVVDLSEYASIIKKRDPEAANQLASLLKYEKQESLVTSTKEFIRNIIRHIFHCYNKCRINPKPNHILTLQVAGYREYLLGNYQLLHYERVRICLRKGWPLKLVLTEINLDFRDKCFPPLFKMDKKITYPVIHVKKYKYEQQEKQLDDWLKK